MENAMKTKICWDALILRPLDYVENGALCFGQKQYDQIWMAKVHFQDIFILKRIFSGTIAYDWALFKYYIIWFVKTLNLRAI